MTTAAPRFAWLKSGLFWRTFILLALLITISMVAWVTGVRMVEREPRARQIAAQVVPMVTITRSALTHSVPDLRRELLFELASNEGIRVYPLEATDVVEPPSESAMMKLIRANVQSKLGEDTRFASKVNDVTGFWVSFKIEDDVYWLMLDRQRIDRSTSTQWLGWGTTTLFLALIGAVFISRLINQPLARISAATHAVAKGQRPDPLPEIGPAEIREANRSFNRMVDDLNRIESDRAVILAGISHDLRTPISRMLLEVEMARLSDDAKAGMHADLSQMDAIIQQFLDYAKPSDPGRFEEIDVADLLGDAARESSRLPDVELISKIESNLHVMGHAVDLQRVLSNLIENARRYGKQHDADMVKIDLSAKRQGDHVVIEVADRGPGVPEHEIERLLRPFTRLDVSRGQANGAGLGLAIVERLIKRHGGKLNLRNREGGGFAIQVMLPAVKHPHRLQTGT